VKERRRKMAKEATLMTRDRVRGERPVHTHICHDNHEWLCNSPYCTDVKTDCPDHGGLEPIPIGYEPWKGR
jgi:hypothetical protein